MKFDCQYNIQINHRQFKLEPDKQLYFDSLLSKLLRGLNIPRLFLYKSIVDDINNRSYPTISKESYTLMSEYYSNSLAIEPVTGNSITPFAVLPDKKFTIVKDRSTPVPLYEPFGDPLARSVNTIAQMIDMFYQKLEFSIISKDDVLNIYARLNRYLQWLRSLPPNVVKDKDVLFFIDKANAFGKSIQEARNKICHERGIITTNHTFEVSFISMANGAFK